MGEEEKKGEEKAAVPKEEKKPPEEAKKEECVARGGGGGEKEGGKEEKAAAEEVPPPPPPPPPPPEEVVMRVYMHCEGCARKVKRCLKGFEGVEDVITDSKAHKVVVKGKKAAADPMKVVDRVQKKTGRKVELLSPIPPPPPTPEEIKKKEEEEEKKKAAEDSPKPEEKKEPQVITVVLKVHMHCEACAQEIKKRILKMKGVQSAEPNLKASEVSVKGTFDPPTKLIDYVYKRTGKQSTIVRTEAPPSDSDPNAPDKSKDDKKSTEEEKKKEEKDEKKDEKGKDHESENGEKKDGDELLMAAKMERMLNEFYHHNYTRALPVGYAAAEYSAYHPYPPPPPQMFSDENPNACSLM